VGDQRSDIEAAAAAGVGTRILLRSPATTPTAGIEDHHVADALDDIQYRFFPSAHLVPETYHE
jgi:phosphoglycolate phosphatase-like HAD superfamily hydrolase